MIRLHYNTKEAFHDILSITSHTIVYAQPHSSTRIVLPPNTSSGRESFCCFPERFQARFWNGRGAKGAKSIIQFTLIRHSKDCSTFQNRQIRRFHFSLTNYEPSISARPAKPRTERSDLRVTNAASPVAYHLVARSHCNIISLLLIPHSHWRNNRTRASRYSAWTFNVLFSSWIMAHVFSDIVAGDTQHQRVATRLEQMHQNTQQFVVLFVQPARVFAPKLSRPVHGAPFETAWFHFGRVLVEWAAHTNSQWRNIWLWLHRYKTRTNDGSLAADFAHRNTIHVSLCWHEHNFSPRHFYIYLKSWTEASSFSCRNCTSSTMSSSSNFLCSRILSCLSTLTCTMAIQCSFATLLSSGFSIRFCRAKPETLETPILLNAVSMKYEQVSLGKLLILFWLLFPSLNHWVCLPRLV